MAFSKKKKIQLLCTAFRDGFQSVYGSRVLPKDYMPIVKMAKDAGIRRFESGGGAAFQSAFFYLNENAFDVMDTFRATMRICKLWRGVLMWSDWIRKAPTLSGFTHKCLKSTA